MRTVATLVFGLRNDSRIKQKMNGVKESFTVILLAEIADRIGQIVGIEPKLAKQFLDIPKEDEFREFNSAEEYEETRKKLLMR